MKGSLIMRLVDITLLLLLSLMAAASFTTSGPVLPVTYELSEEGELIRPIQIAIAADGSLYTSEGEVIDLEALKLLIDAGPTEVEFIADGNALAARMLAIHEVVRHFDRQAAFKVRQISEGGA